MKDYRLINFNDLEWKVTRKEITNNINGKSILLDNLNSKVAFTKVGVNGRFDSHRDDYHHTFIVLEGVLEFTVNSEAFLLEPYNILEVKSGIEHSYQNKSGNEVLLLTFNVQKKN